MAALQSRRLVEVVNRVYNNVEFYRKKMQDMGIEPGDIKSIEDIGKLPFTTKEDLRENYPFGLLASPPPSGYNITIVSADGKTVLGKSVQQEN